MSRIRAPGMEAFLAAMAGRNGCWEWPKSRNADGYGLTKADGKTSLAHRVAYQIARGEIAAGLCACHRCDNRACCNPEHIFLGTQRDNCQDAKAKDRHSRGERNGVARLTDDAVRDIRASAGKVSQSALARKYGVRQSSIWLIQNRKQWSHVQD